ncbi:MAG: glycosyltransferase, partial [Candidatus Rokuibacteriota bacterium]
MPDVVGPVMDEIRVVHVVHSLGVGGLENGVVNLVTGPRSGIRHSIVCLTVAGSFRQRVEPGVAVLELGKRPGHDVRSVLRLAALLRRLRPDVVHSRNWATFDAVVAARLARVPVIVHGEHGRDIADPDGRHPLRNRWRRLLSPLVTRFVTVSDDLRRWLIAIVGIPQAKVTVICNGVDTDRFAPADPGEMRAALGLPREGTLVGTVGRLDPVKDQAGLIRAFAGLAREHADVRLIVAGDGPCRADL